jgi:anti-sigma factor RsiW
VFHCDEFVEWVTAYLEGQLDPETERRFMVHLAECAGCDRYLEQMRATVRVLAELAPQSLPDELQERLLTAFRERRGR